MTTDHEGGGEQNPSRAERRRLDKRARALPEAFATGHSGRVHVRDHYALQGVGDGGIAASARDLVAFYRALFEGEALLGARMRSEMVKDASGEGYGMGIVLGDGYVGHTGGDYGFAAEVVYDPDSRDIAIMLIGDEDGDTDAVYDVLDGR